MRLSRSSRTEINFVLIGISVLAWVLLLFNPGHVVRFEHCAVSDSGPSPAAFKMLLAMNPVSSQLAGWGLMVIAMMLPKLILPVQFIYVQSFKRYRFLCSLLFVLGYLAAWMAAGVFAVAVIMGFHLLMPMSYYPALMVFIVAAVWQFSPGKQRFLNLGHSHYFLSAFGWNACRDSLRFGVTHGVWCIGSGWALMLFPMLLPAGHNLAMMVVTLIMISEHLEHPKAPQWRMDGRTRLLRIAIAQMQLRWKRVPRQG